MKYILICATFFCIACKNSTASLDLSGVYVASFEHEFGKTFDTLFVTQNSRRIYQIERHSEVIRKLDGKVVPKQIITVTWILDFDQAKNTLTELRTGKILIWHSAASILQLGKRMYTRIQAP